MYIKYVKDDDFIKYKYILWSGITNIITFATLNIFVDDCNYILLLKRLIKTKAEGFNYLTKNIIHYKFRLSFSE